MRELFGFPVIESEDVPIPEGPIVFAEPQIYGGFLVPWKFAREIWFDLRCVLTPRQRLWVWLLRQWHRAVDAFMGIRWDR